MDAGTSVSGESSMKILARESWGVDYSHWDKIIVRYDIRTKDKWRVIQILIDDEREKSFYKARRTIKPLIIKDMKEQGIKRKDLIDDLVMPHGVVSRMVEL